MILTVTPNAAVDKTFRIEGFSLDRVNRPSSEMTVAGGKGVNVARVFQRLGGVAIATGFLGGAQGQIVARSLDSEGIPNEFVPCDGETRMCIAVIDPTTGTQTEINESGPEVGSHSTERLAQRIESLLSQHRFEFVILSGSVPPGCPVTIYSDLIHLCRRFGVRAVLDSSGEALRAGMKSLPWMLKPNLAELGAALGESALTLDEAWDAARRLHKTGINIVAVTLGAHGALVVSDHGDWFAAPPPIKFASAVASGDSFVAGFLWAFAYESSTNDVAGALRMAVGAGAANAEVIGAGFISREAVLARAESTTVTAVV